MALLELVDLEERPQLRGTVRALFASQATGQGHLVSGLPHRMGLEPAEDDLNGCLGVLVAVSWRRVAGALAICPYSESQVTLWGPVVPSASEQPQVYPVLLQETRRALREGGFASMRTLVDLRNRTVRAWMMAQGFNPWKDTHCYERSLADHRTADLGAVIQAARADHDDVAKVLAEGFPDSDHWRPNLVQRENDGYRHYLLREGGRPVAAAAVQGGGRRAWLKLIATATAARGRGHAGRLIAGVMGAEARLGHAAIGLEVLADNRAAIALYESAGFHRPFSATILVAPI